MRLNRILSLAGLTSRRKADEWIQKGRVTVNDQRVRALGTTALWGKDFIAVDHQPIPGPSDRLYLMLNKPFGTVCTLHDPQNRPRVTDLIKEVPVRIYPVGRLDFDSLGLLLLTNDGEWAYRLTHPKYQVPRTYKATVSGRIPDQAMDRLKNGVLLEDGPSGPSKAELIQHQADRSIVRVTITQGRSRQVRRMLDAVGLKTIQLMRTAFGSLALGELKVGRYRHLTQDELNSLRKLVGLA